MFQNTVMCVVERNACTSYETQKNSRFSFIPTAVKWKLWKSFWKACNQSFKNTWKDKHIPVYISHVIASFCLTMKWLWHFSYPYFIIKTKAFRAVKYVCLFQFNYSVPAISKIRLDLELNVYCDGKVINIMYFYCIYICPLSFSCVSVVLDVQTIHPMLSYVLQFYTGASKSVGRIQV